MKIKKFKIKACSLLLHPFNSQKRRQKRESLYELENIKTFHRYSGQALAAFSQALQEYPQPIRIWLEFGTLLGAYRENGIIAHDYDLDFAIHEADLTTNFLIHLQKFNIFLNRKFILKSNQIELNNFIAEYTLTYKNKVNIDIFVFREVEKKYQYFCFDAEEGLSWQETLDKYQGGLRAKMRKFNTFSLKPTLFLNHNFLIPDDTHNHLKEIYGDDFMIPKQYSYSERPKDLEILMDDQTIGYIIYNIK